MNSQRNCSRRVILSAALLSLIPLACGPTRSTVTAERKDQLISQLQTARELDVGHASDPNIGPIAREDYLAQAGKADRAIKELTDGFSVSKSEIDEALVVPPVLSPQGKVVLIDRLEKAKHLDDLGADEQDDNPSLKEDFIQQGQRAAEVIKDLQLGNDVPRAEVIDALQVPKNQ